MIHKKKELAEVHAGIGAKCNKTQMYTLITHCVWVVRKRIYNNPHMIYVHTNTPIHMYTHTHTHAHAHAHAHAHTHTHTHTHTYLQ